MSKTVLTVDDSRTMREMLLMALKAAGYNVLQADDGLNGLEVLKMQSADVIITDINMPRLDGFGFIENVRQDTKHRAVPILVLTTDSDQENKRRAPSAAAPGRIATPFPPDNLLHAIRRSSG